MIPGSKTVVALSRPLVPHGGTWRQDARTTPGSQAAIAQGCQCAPAANAYGRGVGEAHRALYLVTPACGLHRALLGDAVDGPGWRALA